MDNAVRGGIGVLTEGDPVEEGWAVKADTIEELATLIDVPADELAQTVAIWNESCDKGVDVQFYRCLLYTSMRLMHVAQDGHAECHPPGRRDDERHLHALSLIHI